MTEKRLKELRQAYEAGESEALLDAVWLCLSDGVPAPEWLLVAYERGRRRYKHCEARDLGEAFGIVRPKGWHHSQARRRANLQTSVWLRVEELWRAGASIDRQLFEKVAEEHAIGKTVAEDLYYSEKRANERAVKNVISGAIALTKYRSREN